MLHRKLPNIIQTNIYGLCRTLANPLLKSHIPAFILTTILINCTSAHYSQKSSFIGFEESYCVPSINYNYDGMPLPISHIDSFLVKNPILVQKFPQHDILVYNAIGVLPDLINLFAIKENPSVEGQLETLRIKQTISDRLILAANEIQAISAELDCEGERVDQVATFLDKTNNDRNKKLIIGSVVIGALTTVESTLASDNLGKVISIAGGLLSVTLGALTINPEGKKVKFLHKRNFLQNIWSDTVSTNYFPPFIWHVLNEEKFSNSGHVTLIQSIKSRWIHFEFKGNIDKKTQNLLFKDGGIYSAETLHLRSSLINQLQSTIRSIHQDLSNAILSLHRIQ